MWLRHVFLSLSSARDKSERAFGVAFVKLMNANGTTLQDGRHDLVVYKVTLLELDLRAVQCTTVPFQCGISGSFQMFVYKLQKSTERHMSLPSLL